MNSRNVTPGTKEYNFDEIEMINMDIFIKDNGHIVLT